VFNVITYTPILDLCLGIVVLCVLQDFKSFYPTFDLKYMNFDLPHRHPSIATLVEQEKSRRPVPSQTTVGPWYLPRTVVSLQLQ